MKHCLPVFTALFALAISVPASAQYMYVDVDGDGECTYFDVLTSTTTSVDLYLYTDRYANGSAAICPTGEALTINSYTFILSAPYGGIHYGAWTDNMGFTINANSYPNGTATAGNDIWVAKASGTHSAPGRYKLGSLALTITAPGYAGLEIHSGSSLDETAFTSFGSECPGSDFDNTMKMASDWTDVCGARPIIAVSETTWGKIKLGYR
jgi:hypothetical protein